MYQFQRIRIFLIKINTGNAGVMHLLEELLQISAAFVIHPGIRKKTADDSGHKTYVRGVTLLMLRAFYAVCKGQPLENVYVQYQIGDSCYCEVSGVPVTESLLQQVPLLFSTISSRNW